MKTIKIGMVAAMAIALLTPAIASAQARAKVDATQHKKGAAEAAAVVAGASATCASPDGYWIGNQKDAKTKTTTDAYELSCQGGLGLIVMKKTAPEGVTYQTFTCLATEEPGPDGKPNSMRCRLPGNENPAAGIAPFVAKAGLVCNVTKARMLGANATNAYFEVACDNNRDWILGASVTFDPTKDVTSSNCLSYEPGGNIECKLVPRATLLSVVDPLAAKAEAGCAVKDRRYMLSNKNGDEYYEVACNDGKGFVVVSDPKGTFKEKVECANADYIMGGCTLTDVKTAKTEDNALYSKLAKAGGFDCTVSGYRPLGTSGGAETVELACSNRPDGAIAIFPAGNAKPRIYNCAAADLTGFRCNLTKPPAAYAQLTAAVKKSRPTSTCVVSDSKFIGINANAGFVEVACSDKEPGYVLSYPKTTDQSDAALYCTQVHDLLNVNCSLPTNLPKK
jgi:hypothetical protein